MSLRAGGGEQYLMSTRGKLSNVITFIQLENTIHCLMSPRSQIQITQKIIGGTLALEVHYQDMTHSEMIYQLGASLWKCFHNEQQALSTLSTNFQSLILLTVISVYTCQLWEFPWPHLVKSICNKPGPGLPLITFSLTLTHDQAVSWPFMQNKHSQSIIKIIPLPEMGESEHLHIILNGFQFSCFCNFYNLSQSFLNIIQNHWWMMQALRQNVSVLKEENESSSEFIC